MTISEKRKAIEAERNDQIKGCIKRMKNAVKDLEDETGEKFHFILSDENLVPIHSTMV